MNISRRLVTRLLVSGAFGLCLALLTIFLTIGGVGGQVVGYQLSHTRRNLEKGDRVLAAYYKKNGVYPPSLDAGGLGFMRDGWGRQFLYSLPNGKPLVESMACVAGLALMPIYRTSTRARPKAPYRFYKP